MKNGSPSADHDVAGLEVAVEEVASLGLEQELGEPLEVVLQRLLVERDLRQAQEVVLEVVEVPHHRLLVEAGPRVAHVVVQRPAGLDLEPRQDLDHLPVQVQRLGREPAVGAIRREELEERRVAQILFQVDPLVEVLGVDLGHGQAALPEVAGELEEGAVLPDVRH